MERRRRSQAIDPELLLANARFIRALMRSVLDDRHLADDAAQQTLLVALEHPPEHGCSLRAWLAIVARNLARRPPRTVREHYQVLEDTLVGHLLPAYRKTKKRKAVATARFYFFDVGVANALLRRGEVR